MPYELLIELARPAARRAVSEALDATPDARRFRAEPRGRTWLGKVRGLALTLPFGGSREEAASFAAAAAGLVRRLGGSLFDPQLGHGLPPGREVEWIVDGWAEANLQALGGYERGGWVVRPAAVPLDDGHAQAFAVEAVRSDAPRDAALSLARAYLRAGAAAPARGLAERLLDADGPGAADADGGRAGAHTEARALLREVERLEDLAGDAGRAALERARPVAGDVPALLEALRHEGTRGRAAVALAALGPAAAEPLLAALADEDLREGAVAALEGLGAAALPGLTRRLARGDRAQAEGALAALDDLFAAAGADVAVVEAAVARLLAEPDLDAPGLSLALERACASVPAAGRAVVRLLRQGAARHAGAAADALGALGARACAEAADALLARLLQAPDPDLDEVALARALAAVAPGAGGERLAAALDGATDAEARARLLHALVEVDATRAVPRLVAAVRRAAADDPTDARPACPDDADFVLATWVRDPAALPAVLAGLDDPLPAVRRALVGALASIGASVAASVAAPGRASGEPAEQVRAALTRLASDPHPEVRAAAKDAAAMPFG